MLLKLSMFKIKSLILLLSISFLISACSNKLIESNNNYKFALDYIPGEFDGLMLKNYLGFFLKSQDLYDPYSNLLLKASITHGQELYVTNINNTSGREKITSTLHIEIINKNEDCSVLVHDQTISQFYLLASSEKYLSNETAIKQIKQQNMENLVKNFFTLNLFNEIACETKN